MISPKKLIVSHAPFRHNGSSISQRSYHTILAALPAALVGMALFGMPAVGVISLSISSAIIWELLLNRVTGRPVTIGDGNAALVGLLYGMLMPATMPWWAVIVGTFTAIVIGKQIYGGIGSNPFNPVLLAVAILMISWKDLFDFDQMLVHYDFTFATAYPLAALKHFGVSAADFPAVDLLLGKQIGGIGSTCGLALIAGGAYLILRGFIRWEITASFLGGILITATCFHMVDPSQYAGPMIHLLSGYTLVGAFFLATEDSSSPVNILAMFIYGALGGVMTILIRNVGDYVDGVVLAILLINVANPLLDKIRPKAIGKVV
ncbi:MAG: RnfABCDGE type electron transport complex subunit D [Deltaproteobacteria bacterium]|nr:RnfABCDGE type electron transport complex subunit D [Deltaproteobacteria bacterium]